VRRPALISTFVLTILLPLLPAAPAAAQQTAYDLVFTGGRILDGTGNPWYPGEVAVRDGRIAALGTLPAGARAERTIDISGLIISPGFIDIHTHSYDSVSDEESWSGEDDSRYFAPNFVSQGVTLVVSNQCGYGPTDIGAQRAALSTRGTGPNVILMIGHNSVRRAVMGRDAERPATADELNRMRALVRQAMEDGAFGMSSGLEYQPAIWSTTDELVALMEEMLPYDGHFQAHERASGITPMWYVPSRDEPAPPSMTDNILELIEIGERTGGRVIATHIKARGVDFWGGSTILIRLINQARARGIDIWADAYPYNSSGSDGSTVLIPGWALGRDPQAALQQVLADPERRDDLERDIRHNLNWRGGGGNIVVMDYPDEACVGRTLQELADERDLSVVEMVIALQLEGDNRRGGARLRGFSMAEQDIEAFYAEPWCCTGSDASITLPADGPVHARYYGTFPRKIRHYAMERGVLSVEDAVRTSTSLPAQVLRLHDRGQLREGNWADIVVFDPATIRDTATFFEPHQYAEGIEYVLVNGVFVLEEGELTWERPGRVLNRR